MIQTRGDVAPAGQMRAGFGQSQILAAALNARIWIDSEIADVRFVYDRLRDRKRRTIGDLCLVMDDYGSPVVGRDCSRVRVDQLTREIEPGVAPASAVGVLDSTPVSEQHRAPRPVAVPRHAQ